MARRIYLNDGWTFTEEFSDGFENGSMVNLPHSVAETPYNYFDEAMYEKVSGYEKNLEIPAEWEGKAVRLTFEGVAHEATVYINGSERIVHKCGYTAFSVDISDVSKAGASVNIKVKVDSRESLDEPPFGYVIDYMTYGGIYRDVYVEISEKTYIDKVFCFSEFGLNATFLCSKVRIKNADRAPLIIKQYVNGQELSKEFPGNGGLESQVYELRMDAGDVRLWDIDVPSLYEVKTEVYSTRNELLDSKTISFGFRKSEFRVDGYYLNDKKVKIRGLNRHQSYAYVGYAMPESMQRLDARILKNELKVNAVRTSHYPQSHDFIDECDRLGILVFMEIPGWQHIGGDAWKDQAVANVKDMVREFRNHPSIILWGVRINESKDCDELYKRTNETAHAFDHTRPTGGVRAIKNSNLFEDVYTYNDFIHDGGSIHCEPKSKVTSDMKKPYLISEYNGHMFPTKTIDDEEHRLEHAMRHANVLDSVSGYEDIVGSFAWCMFDYNTHKDFGSGDRICYHGVMDMFRNPKLAAGVYACESDPKEAKDVVLLVSSSMDIGEHPGGNMGNTWIFSNADSVRMYKNDRLLKEYTRDDSPYKNLKHGPIRITEYVGNAIVEGENFAPWLAADVKKIMNAVALNGLTKLPKKIWAVAVKVMAFGHLNMSDAVSLYTKYVGNWGGSATVYRFEAILNGRVVKTVIKEPAKDIKLIANASETELKAGKSYDVSLVRIKAVDSNENVCPFFNEPVFLKVEGDLELIGPDCIVLQGGMGGTFVKTTSKNGSGKLTIESKRLQKIEIPFTIKEEQ